MKPLFVIAAALLLGGATLAGGQALAIDGIHVYQRTLGPLVARAGVQCRFTPTCSHYGEIAIARDGVVAGSWKTVKRIARCGPWSPVGTRDHP